MSHRVIPSGQLRISPTTHRMEGHEYGAGVSFFLVDYPPGRGNDLHRHPYAEVFIVESGTATFQIGSETIEVTGGHVVVSPAGEAHGFTNTGKDQLRLTAIHGAGQFTTEWLDGPDPVWTSQPQA